MIGNLRDLSRIVSHMLRHEPWRYEIELDSDGWADVNAVLTALRAKNILWTGATEELLLEMIATFPKQRHEMNNGRIRALYGHSVSNIPRRVPVKPPEILFHGCTLDILYRISREGLLPMSRQYVHLSIKRDDAIITAKRKSPNAHVLIVKAIEAWRDSVNFYSASDDIWLADPIPPIYLDLDACVANYREL